MRLTEVRRASGLAFAVACATASVMAAWSGRAAADPILRLPPVGRAVLVGRAGGAAADPGAAEGADPGAGVEPGAGVAGGRSPVAAGWSDPDRRPGGRGPGGGVLAVIADADALAVIAAGPAAVVPELGPVDAPEVDAVAGRVGLVGWGGCTPLGFALRVDMSEPLRLDGDDFSAHPLAATDRLLDDAVVAFTPRSWFQVWLGRQPVPLSRFRSFEHAELMAGQVPRVTDRVAPDRRWGAAVTGDLGAIAYATGVYADGDAVELPAAGQVAPRALDPDRPGLVVDPSAGGRGAVAARLEWTPRAPIGPGDQPAAADDPWAPVARASIGLGALWRWRRADLGQRLDLALSAQGKVGRLSGLAELYLSSDSGQVALGGAAEAGFLATGWLLLFARGDDDVETGWWSAGGGAAWLVTADRWTRVSLSGWIGRRDDSGGDPAGGGPAAPGASGVTVRVQAAL